MTAGGALVEDAERLLQMEIVGRADVDVHDALFLIDRGNHRVRCFERLTPDSPSAVLLVQNDLRHVLGLLVERLLLLVHLGSEFDDPGVFLGHLTGDSCPSVCARPPGPSGTLRVRLPAPCGPDWRLLQTSCERSAAVCSSCVFCVVSWFSLRRRSVSCWFKSRTRARRNVGSDS